MSSDADATKQIVTHLMGIPFFDRLSEAEVEKIYSICRVTKYQADQVIYKFGTPSDGMFILLDGQLVARTKTGMDIAYISPIGLVGEMGVIIVLLGLLMLFVYLHQDRVFNDPRPVTLSLALMTISFVVCSLAYTSKAISVYVIPIGTLDHHTISK